MTFYDYDMDFRRDGAVFYKLRAHAKPLPNGGYCTVYPDGDGGKWIRKTNWQAKWGHGGIRNENFKSLDEGHCSPA